MNEHNRLPGGPAAMRWKTALLFGAVFLAGLVLAAAQLDDPVIERRPDFAMAMYFGLKQDIPVGAGLILILGWLRLRLRGDVGAGGVGAGGGLRLTGWGAFSVLAVPALIAFGLRAIVLPDYDMTRDEQMVTFDAAIYARGHLFEPVAPFWRPFYEALNSIFLLPIGDREAWVSNYLPGNAAIRALLGLVLPPSAAGAVLLLGAAAALWRITLRLWPDSASTRAVVLLAFAVSSQALVTATTTYAMTAHLTANLVWLALFLRRTSLAHAGAFVVGFIATGLHQPVFHPLFVAPFMLLLLRERRWKELAAYCLCYAAIGLFWLSWQLWISAHGVGVMASAVANDGIDHFERLRRVIAMPGRFTWFTMAENLLRLFAWNHPLLLPLAGLGVWALRRDRLVQALWLGMALLIVLLILVMPSQTDGWGYRYMHGFLGSAVLLAGYGWNWLEARSAAPARAFVAATALAALVIVPLQVWFSYGERAAYAAAAARIRAIDADVVIVDRGVPFSENLVINRADLSNRPVLLSVSFLKAADLAPLCARGTIGFADAPLFGTVSRFFRIGEPAAPTPAQTRLKAAAVSAGCRISGGASPPAPTADGAAASTGSPPAR